MEKTVESLLKEEILFTFFERFSIQKEGYKKLGDFENYVFEVNHNGKPLILRLTHSSHRSELELASELDWMNFLHQNGVNVPLAYRSLHNQYVEKIQTQDESYFYACMFSKADGEPVKIQSPHFNDVLFTAWGKEIGKMHRVTKSYKPSEGIIERSSWDEEELLLHIDQYLPDADKNIVIRARELTAELKALPRHQDNFGLIHTDVHSGNFFFDGKNIHLFDFDDSCHHWFASDIAIPLYYSVLYGFSGKSKEEKEAFAKEFLVSFCNGYETETSLPEFWLEQLPYFFQLRDIVLYAVLHKKIAPEDRSEKLQEWLKEIRKRIMNKECIVDIV
jgi:amicoumacin kinase